ncbi:class I SAM-dependent methyltransferase [Algoriphagus kandeliae]|uniref:Class I SAM-dependent methyltransferase n=1 Tax=Algoriphagus kandeliae TaxID=2562278 RepID=A0A4Y9QQG1_9BACT|nr:class I SAM-dependent methyltransferase [Algoriphagus kandeliae]TFV94427.1 class I SAM-dependent methyltransferase [Algoriphagus kandeliae]
MRQNRFFILFLLVASMSFACHAQSNSNDSKSPYKYKTASWDGIGKVYMGREISHIMGFAGKDWLERDSREAEEGVSLAIKNLPITPNSVVADIGAGSGYYSFRIAPLVSEGKVYAVDVQDAAVEYLNRRSQELGIENVIAVKGSSTSPNLPENAIDLAIFVDVYHELEFPEEMLQNLRKSLKSDGKILLIEYRGEDPSVPIKPLHKMTVRQAKKELEANGFELVENGQFLKIQHFLVFQKKEE